MSSPDPVAVALPQTLLALLQASGERSLMLIDGGSGSGKSTLARLLASRWPGAQPTLVRLDDIYPGWAGLDEASRHIHEHLLTPWRDGVPGRWQEFDWVKQRRSRWHEVDPRRGLLVEGCGTMSRANTPLADVRIWVEADADLRKRRALARDAGVFDAHWDDWAADFDRYVAREQPRSRADAILDGSREKAFTLVAR